MNESRPALPWRAIILLALLGTAFGATLALVDLHQTNAKYGGLIHTGPNGPAAALLRRELPDEPQFPLGEHDGPMYYAIARNPFHLDQVSHFLDRPRYRLQHPLLSWLSWAAHPWGGGDEMVWTMFAVGTAAVLLGGIAAGALSSTLGGPVWPALIFGVLPGSVMSLRITVADALAVGLLLAAIVLSLRVHLVLTALAAAAAVLAKEPVFFALVGVALWRRDRDGLALVVPPVLVAGAWYLWLRIQLGPGGQGIMEFGVPFVGLGSSVSLWITGSDPYAAIAVLAAIGVAVAALVRSGGLRHPLGWAVALQLAFMLLLTRDVIGLTRNGTRMSLDVVILGLLTLVTPRAPQTRPARPATAGVGQRGLARRARLT